MRTETVRKLLTAPAGARAVSPLLEPQAKNLMWNWVRVRYRDARDGVAVVARREYTIDK